MKNKKMVVITMAFLIVTLVLMCYKFVTGNYNEGFTCILALVLLVLPSIVDRKTKLCLPGGLQISILVFVFCSQILGEIFHMYLIFPLWDAILHTFSGFVSAAIGFSLLYILNDNENNKNAFTPMTIALVAFCFSLTVGVFWECIEFAFDQFCGLDMQKDYMINKINSVSLDPTQSNKAISIENITSVIINGKELGVGGYLDIGLIDTMKDLICNIIGAVIFIIPGYRYTKNGSCWKFIKNLTPKSKR